MSISLCIIQVPSLVLGPCGCGKTYTLIECAKMLALNAPETYLLICTLSNSAADLYVEKMNSELESKLIVIYFPSSHKW